ncbi:metal-sensitive transcriptional regulator [Candidatus Saccharibacteria bacterium TM7i]|nr:metal-sensitive transcriptional regulator [Candidatus Saccharibacteria bacterium TM7i]
MIEALKKRALHRTKIIQGQMKALEKQIKEDEYCMDILVQSLALQKSLASLNKLVLENHLRTHIAADMASTDNEVQLKAVDELLKLYELNNIRGK